MSILKYSAENPKDTSTKQGQTSPGPSPSFEFVQLGAITENSVAKNVLTSKTQPSSTESSMSRITRGSDGTVGTTLRQWRECDTLGNAMGKPWFCHLCGQTFYMCHLPKHLCRPGTPLHDNGVPWWKWPLLAG